MSIATTISNLLSNQRSGFLSDMTLTATIAGDDYVCLNGQVDRESSMEMMGTITEAGQRLIILTSELTANATTLQAHVTIITVNSIDYILTDVQDDPTGTFKVLSIDSEATIR